MHTIPPSCCQTPLKAKAEKSLNSHDYSMLSNTDILKYNLFDLKGLGDTFKNIACSDMIFFTLKEKLFIYSCSLCTVILFWGKCLSLYNLSQTYTKMGLHI